MSVARPAKPGKTNPGRPRPGKADPGTSKSGPRASLELEPGGLFRAVADATYDWETWTSARGRPLWVNPAVERLTGYTVAECMTMRQYPLPLVHPGDRAKVTEILAAARAGSAGNDVELRVLRKDGGTRWAAISWQSFRGPDGKRQGFRTSVRDIQERKLAEDRLRDALVLVEQAAAARNEFLANVSHELRTPVQCILGYAQLLRADERDGERARKLDVISEQTDHLLAIIGNVLDMAALQVAAPELVPEDFDLRAKLASVVTAATPLAQQKDIALSYLVAADVPSLIRGDRLRLRQILTNLVGNALKFTSRGAVTVRAQLGSQERAVRTLARVPIVIEVQDTGIGIAPEAIERIFEAFTQADSTIARRYGGTGLGLPIARRLCEAMGGRLSVASEVGRGTCFRVELPFERASGERTSALDAPDQEHLPPALSELRVLVVDDGPAVRELTCEMLSALGVAALAAQSGREAVLMATTRPFDLILMDLQMPDLDGLTATQLIRAQLPQDALRPFIVALTADAFGRALALGPTGGMDGFLVKPVRLSDLRSILDRFARIQSAAQETTRHVSESSPALVSSVLDERVIRDLRETRTKTGRTLLQVTGSRVLADTQSLLNACAEALTRRETRTLSQLAHRIKGNCLVIGASQAASLAQTLDDSAQSAKWRAATRALAQLKNAFMMVNDALEQLIQQPSP